jgi:hypothetical protein
MALNKMGYNGAGLQLEVYKTQAAILQYYGPVCGVEPTCSDQNN